MPTFRLRTLLLVGLVLSLAFGWGGVWLRNEWNHVQLRRIRVELTSGELTSDEREARRQQLFGYLQRRSTQRHAVEVLYLQFCDDASLRIWAPAAFRMGAESRALSRLEGRPISVEFLPELRACLLHPDPSVVEQAQRALDSIESGSFTDEPCLPYGSHGE